MERALPFQAPSERITLRARDKRTVRDLRDLAVCAYRSCDAVRISYLKWYDSLEFVSRAR